MAEVTIKGRSLIKQVEVSTDVESDYLTYVPLNGELVCVNDGDSAYLVKGDGDNFVKDCTKVGGGGGSSGSLGVYFGQTNEEIEGVFTKTISTEITDLSSVNFVFLEDVSGMFEFEFIEGTIAPRQICPVISRTSSNITFKALTTFDNTVIEMSLDLEQGISITDFAGTEVEGTTDFQLYSL